MGFENCKKLKSITIPESVNRIDIKAFCSCESLEEINFVSSKKYFKGDFYNCKSLDFSKYQNNMEKMWIDDKKLVGYYLDENETEIVIPDGIEEIAAGVFSFCNKIEKVHLPQSLRKIGTGAFHACNNLKEIRFPEELESIEQEAFKECYTLRKINFSLSLVEIGRFAFQFCIELRDIENFNKKVKMDETCFAGCDKLILNI